MGYLGMEEKTKETIDGEGWLHSGDIGRLDRVSDSSIVYWLNYVFDQDNFLYITGRIKGNWWIVWRDCIVCCV